MAIQPEAIENAGIVPLRNCKKQFRKGDQGFRENGVKKPDATNYLQGTFLALYLYHSQLNKIMNRANNITKTINESKPASATGKDKNGVQDIKPVLSKTEARKNLNSIREAKEIRDQIRSGKNPKKSFDKAIDEL
ncbi:MAG: hypothetical protein ABJB16_06695 [Saprospiraceae bacterium]